MKGGLCIIYTSLLTTVVLSSCALFILIVVSEAAQDPDSANVDLSGLHNVSDKLKAINKDAEPPPQAAVEPEAEKPVPEDQEMTFTETLSLNSVTTDGLPDTGQPPILISLGDNAKLDLKNPDELLFANDSEQHNDTRTFVIADTNEVEDTQHTEKDATEPTPVVKAKSMHETRLAEEAFLNIPSIEIEPTESQKESLEPVDIPIKPQTPHEDIPSFSEWAQKQLAEAEKKDTVQNHSSQPSHSNTNFSSKSTKLRSKNYASPACGAKIVAVNPEAGSPSAILSPNRDEYMLNTCNSRIWFVVELCEAVQAQKIEIANFELFSSTPKDIAVYFSDRFPTREWASVGQFTAKDIRDVQSFDLFPHLFGKFIKVEMLSHHGSEHYCPISLFKVYGTSEFEVLEKESSQHAAHVDEDEDDEIIDVPDVPAIESEPSKNLFGSAKDAVMSLMKAAQAALVKTEVPKNVSSEHNDTTTDKMYKQCCSPSHIIVCDNCSETLYNEVYELISCHSDKLTNMLRQVFLRETLKCTEICQSFGLDFKSTKTIEFNSERVAYVSALFPPKYLAALCNILAIKEKKVVLNTSFESDTNVTANFTIDETPQLNSDTNAEQEIKLVPDKSNTCTDDKINETVQTEQSNLEKVAETVSEEQTDDRVKVDDKKDESLIVFEDKPSSNDQNEESKGPEIEKSTEAPMDVEQKDSIPKPDVKNGKTESTDKTKDQNGNVVEEGEQMAIDNDNFMSDFDQMAVDPTPPGLKQNNNQNQNQGQTTFQKESVFLRLSNRVKTLERNMSLSGQYLEELSRRYKKQVEEMQKTFEKTVQQMIEERRKSTERENRYLEQMNTLQEQLAQVSVALNLLTDDHNSWFGTITLFRFIVLQSIIIAVVFYYINKRRKPEAIILPISKKTKKRQDKLRRKSVEGVSGHATPSAKKRRPSEEALQIARQSANEEGLEDEDGDWQVARKNRRRKTSIVHRNQESKMDWSRQDSIGEIQENPIPLDEAEFLAPVSEPVIFNENDEMDPPPEQVQPKTNGSFLSNLKTKTKARRLSSPGFLRSFSRQSSRSITSPVQNSRGPEALYNGKVNRKASSESPTSSLWSESTEISQNGLPSDIENGGKKKKSLKNIFKKVF